MSFDCAEEYLGLKRFCPDWAPYSMVPLPNSPFLSFNYAIYFYQQWCGRKEKYYPGSQWFAIHWGWTSEEIGNNILSWTKRKLYQVNDWGGLHLSIAGIPNLMKDHLPFFESRNQLRSLKGTICVMLSCLSSFDQLKPGPLSNTCFLDWLRVSSLNMGF